MRLVIHLGATKTASTFLQKCLFANEALLRGRGVYLPKAGRLPWGVDVASHHNLAWEMYGDRRFREDSGRWSDMLAEVAEAGAETVLISTEAFARLASDPQLRTFMARRLAEASDDVTLLYVVREPLARINSMYGQTVKTFAAMSTFDEYVRQSMTSGLYDLEKSFRFWYESPDVRFVAIRFDELVKNGPFETLLQAAGIDIPREQLTIPQDVVNPSPGPKALEAMRLLNARIRVMDPSFNRRSVPTAKLSQVAQRRAAKLGWYDEPYWGWDPAAAERVARRLRPSNQRFAHAVWGIDWPLRLPVDRQTATLDLMSADQDVHDEIEAYLKAMVKRYRDMLQDRPRGRRKHGTDAEGAGTSNGTGDGHDQDHDHDHDGDHADDEADMDEDVRLDEDDTDDDGS